MAARKGADMSDVAAGAGPEHERIAELEGRLATEIAIRAQLVDLAVRLNSTLNVDELLQLIMTSAADLLEAETSSLMLLDEDSEELVIEVATGDVGDSVAKTRIPAGAGIAGWTLAHREPAIIDDPLSDGRYFSDVADAVGFETRNMIAVPLLTKDRAVGVVEVINKRDEAGFTPRDVEVAQALAALAAIAIDNAALYAQLADAVVTARMSYRL